MTDKITIRSVRDTDRNFILSTWLKEYKQSALCRRMDDAEYFNTYEPLLKELISNVKPTVACLTDEPDVIVGYMVSTYNCIHFAYTKSSWRKFGIMKMLIREAKFQGPVYFTHWTSPVNALMHKYAGFIYNPFKLIAWRQYEQSQPEDHE